MSNKLPTESSTEPTAPQAVDARRRIVLGAAAAIAGAAGVGFAWWRYQPHAMDVGAEGQFWTQQFDTLDQKPLAMGAFKGRPLVLNFWATWCPPCVEELPLLDAFYGQNSAKGWNVIGLAVDQADAVRTFLRKVPLQFPVALAGLGGTSLSKSLGNLTGALPFTVVFDANGVVAHRKMGLVTTDDLAKWLSLG